MTERRKLGVMASVLAVAFGGQLVCFPVFAENPVDINIVEVVDDGNGGYKPWEDITDATPGMTYSAIPRVKNDGEAIVSVRMCLSESAVDADGNAILLEAGTFAIDVNDKYWTLDAGEDEGGSISSPIDVCYKYNAELAVGEVTEPLFYGVTLSSELGNNYGGSTFKLHLYADAAGDLPANPDTGANTKPESLTTAGYVSLSVGLVILVGMIIYLLSKKAQKR